MHNEIITAAGPNKKGVSLKQEPRLLGCRYLSVRRGNPTSEASRQKAVAWEHRSGSGLAEIGWLNSCEHHGSVTFDRLKVLTSLNQKGVRVGSPSKGVGDSSFNSRRTRKMQPHRSQLLTGQQGKPYSPRREAVSRPQGMGMVVSQGRGRVGSSRRRQPGTLTFATEPGRAVALAAIIVERSTGELRRGRLPGAVSLSGPQRRSGADEGIRAPSRVCPLGPLVRRRSECRGAWVMWSCVASRGPS
jgi:hypothetical protein